MAGDFGEAGGDAGDDDFDLAGDADAAQLTGEVPVSPPTDFAPEDPPAENAAPVAESPDAAAAEKEPAGPPSEPDVPHSEATGGDALLDIALEDEARRTRRAPIGLRVTADASLLRCPAGHPIRVKRKHAGKVGRCPDPDCRLRYLVPDIPPDAPGENGPEIDANADTDEQPTRDPLAAGAFTKWIDGPALHAVDPAKLEKVKRAPGSLAKGGVPADLALSADTLLVLELKGKGGPAGPRRREAGRVAGRKPGSTSPATTPASPTCRASIW